MAAPETDGRNQPFPMDYSCRNMQGSEYLASRTMCFAVGSDVEACALPSLGMNRNFYLDTPLGGHTLGDANLDRLVHNAHKINLKGDSLRRNKKES
jgi:hypothetical protein